MLFPVRIIEYKKKSKHLIFPKERPLPNNSLVEKIKITKAGNPYWNPAFKK